MLKENEKKRLQLSALIKEKLEGEVYWLPSWAFVCKSA